MKLSRWIDQAKKIQSIPSPTFEEAQRAAYLAAQLKELGAPEVEIDGDHNVLARIPGRSGPPLVVSAHLDSVFPLDTDLTMKATKQTLRGPGIGDNAVAVAALIELAHDLLNDPPPGDIWLAGNIGEEGLGNLAGMQTVVKRFGSRPLAYLVLEGMSLGFVYHRALPIRRYNLEVKTQGGHSWIHAGRPSAAHILLQIGARLAQLPLTAEPRTSLNVGRLRGGTSINTIASHAQMEIELRSEQEALVQSYQATIEEIIDEFKTPIIDLSLTTIGTRPGGALAADHPLVKAAVQSLQTVGEQLVALEIGSTDASWPLSRGLPSVCVGLTRGGDAHTLHEYIELDPLARGYQALRFLMDAAFEFNP
ncbi:MAG: M20/M25/M40 family metallo-hydrolase [Anaerolineales bacterium]|jgi:acetylornithine deacetylase/succinyl-diaminopimelate desuccinylase-like protein